MKKLLFFILFVVLTNTAFSQSYPKKKRANNKTSRAIPPKVYEKYFLVISDDGKKIDTGAIIVGQPNLVKHN